ncbi:hypothetical protein PRIO_2213 [Paenibacillus riograndensis SBR5]|uniref:Uncharacterized protein n=1 Tax=Paenibacillus riograndensis SBR5 TaxID=1073571 RepID=A0A0E4H9G4_9BACL|nr:hypothetical protein PRIO_2213 [Paenibacillus riograndensis SBR5]
MMSIVFFIIFNSYNGVLNQFLLKYHLVGEPVSWLGPKYAMLTTIMIDLGSCRQLHTALPGWTAGHTGGSVRSCVHRRSK